MNNELITQIQPHKLWLHKNGKTYEVLNIANLKARADEQDEYPIMIIYKLFDSEDSTIWCKTPENFIRSRTKFIE